MTKLVSLSDKNTIQKRNFLKFAGVLKSQAKELERLKKQIEKDRQRKASGSLKRV